MESLGIKCPIHPSEPIQRIDGRHGAKKTLFCLECITQSGDANTLLKSLQTIPTFIKNASAFYTQNKASFQPSSETPNQYSKILCNQAEDLEKLTKHIEQEKKKVETIFDQLTAQVLQQLQQKKNEYMNFFDEQLTSLTSLYLSLENQIIRTFPKHEDLDYLYTSKEELEKRFAQVNTAAQLKSFIEGIKEDISQAEIFGKLQEKPELKKRYLEDSFKKFNEVKNLKPSIDTKNFNFEEMDMKLTKLKEALDKILEDSITIKDTIPTLSVKPFVELKKIRLAGSDYDQQGWGMISHRYYDNDKRDVNSTYAVIHRNGQYTQTLNFVKVGSNYKIVLVSDDPQNNWMLTCHKYYDGDERDCNSTRVFFHKNEHNGQLWSLKEEGQYFRIVLADSTSSENGWYLSAHRCYDQDKRDFNSSYLFVHRNPIEGQLWEIEDTF